MSKKRRIDQLTINGFMSIRRLDNFSLNDLNVLIGANGSGKSNLVSYFRMLGELVEGRLQVWVGKRGGADRVLSFGVQETSHLHSYVKFGPNGYRFNLEPTAADGFIFVHESTFFEGVIYPNSRRRTLGSGHTESQLKQAAIATPGKDADYCYSSISSWKVFHFHDTSDTAGVKRPGAVHVNDYLRSDASNLAAFLYRMQIEHQDVYNQIRRTVALAIPFFDDFDLRPQATKSGEEMISLLWKQKDSDYPFWPSQLSDGSIRFICLATALLQPDPPSTIIIDEPELGLHPYAITLLGALIKAASNRMQVIVSTQSVPLLNEFAINDLIVVEREEGASVFKRLDEEELASWLEEYTIGELWEKNILGGRPG
jgi:predicted ATPase